MKVMKIFFAALLTTLLVTLLVLISSSCDAVGGDASGYASLSDVVVYDGVTYVADFGQQCLYKITENGKSQKLALEESPNAFALSDDGSTLYVVCGEAQGKLIRVNTKTWKKSGTASIGHTPTDVVYANGSLYIAERFDNALRKVDAEALTTTKVVDTVREPIGVTVAGDYVYVAAHLPEEVASESMESDVAVHSVADLTEKPRIELATGSTGARGITTSPDGKIVYVAHTLGRNNVATTHLDRGWVYTNCVSVLNAENQSFMATVLIDDIDRGASNPWGIVCTDDTLVVAVAGTGEIITLDTESLLNAITKSKAPEDIANTLDFAYKYKVRTDLGDSGLRAVAVGDGCYVAANYFAGTVQYVDAKSLAVTKEVDLSTDTELSDERLGEILWNDASICYQEWMTCASCHPDARSDALNWDNLNDGMGTPKQARTLLYTFERGRVMATGIRPDAATAVRAGALYICFNDGITTDQLNQLGAYVKALKPVESPYLENGTLTEAAARGKELFEGKANCISCHSNSVYGQDVLIENFTQIGNESRGLLVPPIIEVWRTAPYLYDGRAATIHEVLTTFNPLDENGKTKHGKVSDLTEAELADLEEYVLSLTEKADK